MKKLKITKDMFDELDFKVDIDPKQMKPMCHCDACLARKTLINQMIDSMRLRLHPSIINKPPGLKKRDSLSKGEYAKYQKTKKNPRLPN